MRGSTWGALVAVSMLVGGCMAQRSASQIDAATQALTQPEPAGIASQASLLDGPDISVAHRQQVGDQYARMILERSTKSPDRAVEAKLNGIVTQLAHHIGDANFRYKVHLLEDKQPNAFTSGGGHLFVTTGLVGVLKSEGQMAMVLAHEMAHNELAHVIKGAHGRDLAQRAASFSDKVLNKQLGLTWIGSSLDFLVETGMNKYTREQEDQADLYGLKFIVAAGYDPFVAPRAVRELSNGVGEQSEWKNFFNGRHPTTKMRIWRLNNLIKAHFYNIDVAAQRRSTAEYDRLAKPYWAASQNS